METKPIETDSYFCYMMDDSLEEFNKNSGFPKIGVFKSDWMFSYKISPSPARAIGHEGGSSCRNSYGLCQTHWWKWLFLALKMGVRGRILSFCWSYKFLQNAAFCFKCYLPRWSDPDITKLHRLPRPYVLTQKKKINRKNCKSSVLSV